MKDPVESIIEDALINSGYCFEREKNGLDFYIPSLDLYIECKQFHSNRISDQMGRVPNIIAIQGKQAAYAFYTMVALKTAKV